MRALNIVCGSPTNCCPSPFSATAVYPFIVRRKNYVMSLLEKRFGLVNTGYTYLLTTWCRVLLEKLNWFAASQEIPRISRNPKVHHRTHKRPPTVSILGQPNPFHIPTSHLLEIRPNIIHPSTPRSPQWSLSLRFLHQDPIQYRLDILDGNA